MTIITGTNNAEEMSGKTGSDTLLGLAGNDILTGNTAGPRELLIDGSFETANVAPNTYAKFMKVGGWQSDTGIEKAIVVTDDGRDTHVYLDVGDRYVELVVLENITGFTTHDMLDNGMLLAG